MMTVATEKTVRELALENPSSTRVFEKLGIDYCCGGNRSLEEACRTANLKVDQVLESLTIADQTALAARGDRDWQKHTGRERSTRTPVREGLLGAWQGSS